jgi:hypothetical protein
MKKLLLLYVYEDGKDIVEDDDNELYIRFIPLLSCAISRHSRGRCGV